MDLQPGLASKIWDRVGEGRKKQHWMKEASEYFYGVNINVLFNFESKKNVILE
jgi:hypothetical protein